MNVSSAVCTLATVTDAMALGEARGVAFVAVASGRGSGCCCCCNTCPNLARALRGAARRGEAPFSFDLAAGAGLPRRCNFASSAVVCIEAARARGACRRPTNRGRGEIRPSGRGAFPSTGCRRQSGRTALAGTEMKGVPRDRGAVAAAMRRHGYASHAAAAAPRGSWGVRRRRRQGRPGCRCGV
eukprot:183170-Chlamydomonas_euryale.AAC.6